MTESRTSASTPASHRSPKYPCLDLSTAIDRATIVFQEVGRHPTGIEVLAKCWGFKPTSGTFRINLAAVRAFGLLEGYLNGALRLGKLTALALDIVVDYASGSAEWRHAVQTAARKPQIYSALWERYSTDLPADDELRRYLIREKSFTDKAAGEFIKQFRATAAFVQSAAAGGPSDGRTADDRCDSPVAGADFGPPMASRHVLQRTAKQAGLRQDVFTLEEGECILQWPNELSPTGFEDFRDWLNLVIRKAKRLAQAGAADALG